MLTRQHAQLSTLVQKSRLPASKSQMALLARVAKVCQSEGIERAFTVVAKSIGAVSR